MLLDRQCAGLHIFEKSSDRRKAVFFFRSARYDLLFDLLFGLLFELLFGLLDNLFINRLYG